MDVLCITEKQLLSRLLYCNPVCLLSTPAVRAKPLADESILAQSADKARPCPNVMTISWLTPVDNGGGIILCLNSKRHTAGRLMSAESFHFVLNVPVAGMESMILDIGSCSGDEVDKFDAFNIPLCLPGWGLAETEFPGDPSRFHGKKLKMYQRSVISSRLPAIAPSVAHIICEVRSHTPEAQLVLEGESVVITAKMLFAFVRSGYWCGKNFIPRDMSLPPLLSFLGTKTFAYICAAPYTAPVSESTETHTSQLISDDEEARQTDSREVVGLARQR